MAIVSSIHAKVITLILIGIVLLTPVGAVSLTDGSANFLRKFGDSTGQIRHISLTITALAEANGRVKDDLSPRIRDLARELLSYQNPDGGWGYFPGSVSNVIDTSYALIALSKAKPYFENTEDFETVTQSIEEGVDFIRSSKSGSGWGPVGGSKPLFYPTAMALWALGENGYNVSDSEIESAAKSLDSLPRYLDKYTALALKMIALKSVDLSVSSSEIKRIKEALKDENLSPAQRAILTYALTLYSEPTFEVVAMVAKLDKIKHTGGNMVFWADTPKYPLSITDTVTPTAYTLMAISELVPPIEESSINPNEMPCDQLISYQNPDGGWGVFRGGPSNEKATYYALLAVEVCYPAPSVIERALNWTARRLKEDERYVLNQSKMTVGYYYALMTLLHFKMLNETEKEHAIQVIRSIKLETGKWGIKELGPQPSETAMAVSALLSLGVEPSDPDIKAAKNWLLSISSTGWGTYYQVGMYPLLFDVNVLDTLTVLKALEGISSEEELKPHLKWLVNQRTGKGWPYIKEYHDVNGSTVKGEPRVDLTVEATLLLMRHRIDYTTETLEFVREMRNSGRIENDTIETAASVIYLSSFNKMPLVDLADVRTALETSTFYVLIPEDRVENGNAALESLRGLFGFKFSLGPLSIVGHGNSIVLAGFSDVNVTKYNRHITLYTTGTTIEINGKTYPRDNTVLLLPGRTAEGVVLFILYDEESWELVKLTLNIGYLKYMQGNGVVIHFKDKNGNGQVDLDEVTAETLE